MAAGYLQDKQQPKGTLGRYTHSTPSHAVQSHQVTGCCKAQHAIVCVSTGLQVQEQQWLAG